MHSCVICVLFVSAKKSCWLRRCWIVISSIVANASHDVSIFLFRIQWKKRIRRRLSAVLDNARLLSALSKGLTLTPKLTDRWSGLLRLTSKRKTKKKKKKLFYLVHCQQLFHNIPLTFPIISISIFFKKKFKNYVSKEQKKKRRRKKKRIFKNHIHQQIYNWKPIENINFFLKTIFFCNVCKRINCKFKIKHCVGEQRAKHFARNRHEFKTKQTKSNQKTTLICTCISKRWTFFGPDFLFGYSRSRGFTASLHTGHNELTCSDVNNSRSRVWSSAIQTTKQKY